VDLGNGTSSPWCWNCRGKTYRQQLQSVEEGEDFFQTAIRETEEESNITDLHFKWGLDYRKTDRLRVYLAETTQEGKIVRNKESGILEHEHLRWMDWDEMIEKTYEYLKPAIEWSKERVLYNEPKEDKNI